MTASLPPSSILAAGITLWEASAGTGKTFRIAHTILRLVAEEGASIERIVVVTFTEAATAELRDRVRRRLRDGLEGLRSRSDGTPWTAPDGDLEAFVDDPGASGPAVAQARLRQALLDFDESLISTIHGFCHRMLRRNAFESGASFGAEVVADIQDVRDDLATDFWTRLVHDAPAALTPALKAAGLEPGRLKNLARKAADQDLEIVPPPPPAGSPTTLPDAGPWIAAHDDLVAAWDVDVARGAFADGTVTVHTRQGAYESFPAGRTKSMAWSVHRHLRGGRPYPTDELTDAFEFFDRDRVARGTWAGQTPPTNAALEAMWQFQEVHRDLQPQFAPVIQGAKHELVRQLREELPRRARARNLRTYHDLLVDLRNGLRRSGGAAGALGRAVRERYDVALIDEFQDTDPVQWEIFSTLFSDRMCLIGDPKQAIYSFRGADVFTYERARQSLSRPPEGLGRNFRTDAPLLEALGVLFERDEPFGAEAPLYPTVEAEHASSRLLADPRPPLLIRHLPREGAQLDRWGNYIARGFMTQRMPGLVAADVADELARGGRIALAEGGSRPITAGDCAVLVRTNKEAAAVQRSLRALGIPSVVKSDASVLESPEATDLAAVLAAVAEPASTGLVRRALATPLMGRTANRLVQVEEEPDAFDDEVGPFHRWSALWGDEGFASMFQRLLDDDAMLARLLEREGGDRRVTNLVHLGEVLTRVSVERQLGPAGLLAWLAQGGPGADPEDLGLRLEGDADAAKVVTMHSAKGLEWPLVWCPSLYYSMGLWGDDKHHLVFHDPDDGQAAKLDIGSAQYDQHLAQRELETFQEDLRLVYVALTRARHRCVVYWGGVDRKAALAWLIHVPDCQPSQFPQFGAAKRMKEEAVLCSDLSVLARHPAIGVEEVDWDRAVPPPRYDAGDDGAATLETRELTRPRPLDSWWRRSSFTGLVRGRAVVGDVRDHDERDDDDPSEGEVVLPTAAVDAGPIVLADFEAGARVGVLLHSILEEADFQDPAALEPLVSAHLGGAGIGPEWTAPVTEGLDLAIRTPLGPEGFSLADVPRRCRLDELEFTIPVQGGFDAAPDSLTTLRLAEVFAEGGGPGLPDSWADQVRGLRFLPLRGFLGGFIDLIFVHEGRWYVVDYKSNKLGTTYADYAADRLPDHMVHSQYVLQYHLYSLALHRYLRWRLTDYDYEASFGGVYYLFLRGMRPDLGPQCGVFADRPSKELMDRLEAAVCGGAS